MNRQKNTRLTGLVFAVIGLLGGAYFAFDAWEFQSNSIQVNGTVTEYFPRLRKPSVRRSRGASVSVKYSVEGVEYQAKVGVSAGRRPASGDPITFLVNRYKPDDARPAGLSLWLVPIVLLTFAVIGLAMLGSSPSEETAD